jgi:putative transposase
LALSVEEKRALTEADGELIPLARQCQLLSLSRSSFYYQPVAPSRERQRELEQDQQIMRLLDEQYTRTPFYGSRRLGQWLRQQGYTVNRKRVGRLLREMGLQAVFPGPRLSVPQPGHRIYPYLLRGLAVKHVNQVWSTDITYIRLYRGNVYLVAIMDWYSRYVLNWELSISLEGSFCQEVLRRSLEKAQPDIFNTDQGSQFTSADFTDLLEQAQVRISMDGRGRALDNIFIERLWRTVKYEEVYLKDYDSPKTAALSLSHYFHFYNEERPHQSLGYQTPGSVYRRENDLP